MWSVINVLRFQPTQVLCLKGHNKYVDFRTQSSLVIHSFILLFQYVAEATSVSGLLWSGVKPLWLKDQLSPVQPLNPL